MVFILKLASLITSVELKLMNNLKLYSMLDEIAGIETTEPPLLYLITGCPV